MNEIINNKLTARGLEEQNPTDLNGRNESPEATKMPACLRYELTSCFVRFFHPADPLKPSVAPTQPEALKQAHFTIIFSLQEPLTRLVGNLTKSAEHTFSSKGAVS